MRLAAALGLLALAACASVPAERAEAPAANPGASVEVVRDGDRWTADYDFTGAAPAWLFVHSALKREGEKPWRPESWTFETPGVHLERHGWYDVLVADSGGPVPDHVRIAFRPLAEGLLADYDPALAFTDGSVALFSDQFDVIPLATAASADALPLDLAEASLVDPGTSVTFRDRAGPVLAQGTRSAAVTLTNGQTYALFGGKVAEAPAISTLFDPALPSWLSAELGAFAPRTLAYYAERLGPRSGPKPMLMVSWAGPTPHFRSMGGSVLPGLVLMRFEGDAVIRPDPAVRNSARWFIAHESAHFWLGQTVRYEFARDAWFTEGGADLLAMRAGAALDPAFDARAMLQQSLDDCVELAKGKAIATAAERNEHRAYYACGAMFGLLAEASAKRSGGDFFSFIRTLIEHNQADQIVTADEWLAALTQVSGDPGLAEGVRKMVETGVADPPATLASLFARAGVPATRVADGRLVLS